MLNLTPVLIALWFASNAAAASPVTNFAKTTQIFQNLDCKATDTCSLRSFSVEVNDYRVRFSDGDSFGTRMAATYETDSLGSLEKFVIVQFIRGCQFHSKLVNGAVEKRLDVRREFFGKQVRFAHPTWVVDSVDDDPVYWSGADTGRNRHDAYAWNDSPDSTIEQGRHRYGQAKPRNPKLYVTDFPGSVCALGDSANNLSQQFRTCLYRAGDVPLRATPEDVEFGAPIHCFDWASSFIYDHFERAYKKTDAIDPICAEPT